MLRLVVTNWIARKRRLFVETPEQWFLTWVRSNP